MNIYINLFILFIIYSFLGWVLETAYATFNAKKFVNRGFLTGFFCPIYGFGAVLTVQTFELINIYIENDVIFTAVGILSAVILVTLLEYITGFLLEKFFDCKWWDYSDNFANIKGYVCLSYSLLWGVLIFLLITAINPAIMSFVNSINMQIKTWIAGIAIVYFTLDFIKSIIDALDLRDAIINYSKFSADEFRIKIRHYKRIFKAFPRLMHLKIDVKNIKIKEILNEKLDMVKVKIEDKMKNH